MSFDNSPRRPLPASSGTVSSKSWAEWTQQLQAYVAWVNSQLRKKPGTREVKDLRRELQDGTVLVELIEIVANEKIPGAHPNPANSIEMKENIDRVLQFMRSRKIKMHQIRSLDIVEGNMKAIMRLILALAAHFKPSSVKQSSHQSVKSSRSLGIAQEAASALASIRKDAESIRRKMHRPANLEHRHANLERRLASGEETLASSGNTSTPLATDNQAVSRRLSYDSPGVASAGRMSPSLKSIASSKSSHDSSSDVDTADQIQSLIEDVQESQGELIDETRAAHNLLLELQNLLLSGQEGEELDESWTVNENTASHEQLVVYQARLQQAENTNSRLRDELNRSKSECMQLQGMKQGLHQRLSEQQQEILLMKAKQLRAGLRDEEKTTPLEEAEDEEENELLRDEITEKTTLINRLNTEIERRDKTIEHIKSELLTHTNHTNEIINSLESQVKDLEEKLSSTEFELNLAKETDKYKPSAEKLDPQSVSDAALSSEIEKAESALRELGASGALPTQLQTLESVLSLLVSKVKDVNKQSKPTAEVKGHRVLQRANLNKPETTKMLCFTSKSVTPSMKTVQKKLEEITLSDFKTAFASQAGESIHRKYLFKSLDPEFGTVKEELTEDSDNLPGWEGKIIGWIEDDLS